MFGIPRYTLVYLCILIMVMGFASAKFGIDNPTIPKLNTLPVVASSGTGGDTINNYYNITNVNGSSYNSTYANFAYNHTSVCTAYTDSKVYNHTTATFNLYGLNWYNHSNIDSKKFWYNMTSTGGSVTFPNCGANEVLTNRSGGLTCVTDQTGGVDSAPADDLSINLSQGILVYEQFLTASAIETGELGTMGWAYAGTVTSNAPYSGNHPGTIKISTGTASNSNNSIDLGANTMMFDAVTGNVTWCYLLNVSYKPDMTNNYTLIVGLHDFSATASVVVDGMAFIVNTTLTNWTIVQRANGNMWLNTTNWGINGSWNKLCGVHQNVSGLYRNSYYINGQLVTQTNMTSMPYGTARAFGTGITLKKYGGTTARTVDVDYYYFKQLFQVPRE